MAASKYYNSYYSDYEAVRVCDLCGQIISDETYTTDEVYLCSNCMYRMDKLDNGHIKNCIMKFTMGNVC